MRILIWLCLAAPLASAQDLTQRTFLMRADTTTVDTYSGMTHTCILVYPDGKYRIEKSFQSSQGGPPDMRIYLDQLPDASLKEIQALLDDQALLQISTAEPRGGIIQDMDIFTLTVPREHAVQNLNFETAAERKPYEKTLKPLFSWMKDVQKRKVPVTKNASSDNCRPPQVMYRTRIQLQHDSGPKATGSASDSQ